MDVRGKSFCFTGTMSKPRCQVESEIRGMGGKVSHKVTGRTDFLVVGGCITGKSAKLADAQRLGVKVITAAELMA